MIDIKITELRQVDASTNTNKFYRAYRVEGVTDENGRLRAMAVFHWGRIGTKGQWKAEHLPEGRSAQAVEAKLKDKQKNGYQSYRVVEMDVMPEELYRFLNAGDDAGNESLDLVSMLTAAQKMTVDLMEGTATAKDVVHLRERAKRAAELHDQLEGRLQVLQLLVMQGV